MTSIWYYLQDWDIKKKSDLLEIVVKNGSKHISYILYKGNMLLLNMTCICISCWVWVILTLLLVLLRFGKFVCLSFDYIVTMTSDPDFESNSTRLRSRVVDMFNRSSLYKFKPLIPHLTLSTTILNHSQQIYKVLCFVLMRWEKLWPSFDRSHPVDSSSLSKKMI